MKKRKKTKLSKNLVSTIIIILVLALIIFFSLNEKSPETDSEVVECIGEKSTLYVQLGCSHCRTQEEIFGENLNYLNKIDCFYEPEKCEGVTATPTWEIKGDYYVGVKKIEELKELTNC